MFRTTSHGTMTSTKIPSDDETPPTVEIEEALEHLANALDADEMDETNYHIREALQLLTIGAY